MTEPANEPRCEHCAYFHSTRQDATRGVLVGECAHGVWPPVRPASSSCPDYVVRGGLLRAERAPRAKLRTTGESSTPRAPVEIEVDMDEATFRSVLREIIADELGVVDSPIGDRWKGGELVLKPGKTGTQEKRVPLEKFFHKIVMVRDKLRVLEQRINAHGTLSAEEKVTMQQYVTAAYGSLTTFNVLFRDEDDKFSGASGEKE